MKTIPVMAITNKNPKKAGFTRCKLLEVKKDEIESIRLSNKASHIFTLETRDNEILVQGYKDFTEVGNFLENLPDTVTLEAVNSIKVGDLYYMPDANKYFYVIDSYGVGGGFVKFVVMTINSKKAGNSRRRTDGSRFFSTDPSDFLKDVYNGKLIRIDDFKGKKELAEIMGNVAKNINLIEGSKCWETMPIDKIDEELEETENDDDWFPDFELDV